MVLFCRKARLHSKTNFITSHLLNMSGGDNKVCQTLDFVNTNLFDSKELIAQQVLADVVKYLMLRRWDVNEVCFRME